MVIILKEIKQDPDFNKKDLLKVFVRIWNNWVNNLFMRLI